MTSRDIKEASQKSSDVALTVNDTCGTQEDGLYFIWQTVPKSCAVSARWYTKHFIRVISQMLFSGKGSELFLPVCHIYSEYCT